MVSRRRFEERRADAVNAAQRLQELLREPRNDIVRDIVRDAAIQRFEFTFEAMWKALRLYLEHLGLPAGSPREAIKQAFAQGLIVTENEADAWLAMLEDRNLTSHIYVEALANQVYDQIVASHAATLQAMAQRLKTLTWP